MIQLIRHQTYKIFRSALVVAIGFAFVDQAQWVTCVHIVVGALLFILAWETT